MFQGKYLTQDSKKNDVSCTCIVPSVEGRLNNCGREHKKESWVAYFLLGKAKPLCSTIQPPAHYHYIKSHEVLRMTESVLAMREDNIASISKMWFIIWQRQSPRSGQSHVAFLITKTQNLLHKMMSHRLPSASHPSTLCHHLHCNSGLLTTGAV